MALSDSSIRALELKFALRKDSEGRVSASADVKKKANAVAIVWGCMLMV